MSKRFNYLRLFLGVVIFTLSFLITNKINTSNVYAEDKIPPVYLQVSPASAQLGELNPGDTYNNKFKVYNAGTKEFSYEVYATPYFVTNEYYDPIYDSKENYSMIANWFNFSQTKGTLQPGESHEISYTINVPANVPGGGQYASIMVETKDTAKKDDIIQATSRVGMIIYSHVNGHTNKCGNILETNIPGFLTSGPIRATSLVENCGNVDQYATYILKVTPLFSSEEVYSNEDHPQKLSTLPETKRFNAIEWTSAPLLGIFNVEEIVNYAGKTETAHKLVIICPVWIIVLVIAFIAAVVFWIVSRKKSRKSAKKESEE